MIDSKVKITLIVLECKSSGLSYLEAAQIVYRFFDFNSYIVPTTHEVIEKIYNISYDEIEAQDTIKRTQRLIEAYKTRE